jgi:hypothetical protein
MSKVTLPKEWYIEQDWSDLSRRCINWIRNIKKWHGNYGCYGMLNNKWNQYWEWWTARDFEKYGAVQITFQHLRKYIQSEEINTTPKRNTYSKQYVRQDWIVFTKYSIDWQGIDIIKKEIEEHKQAIANKTSLLNSHKNMRF